MATYEQIMTALRNADAAGDTAAATRLAQMAREARSAPQAAQPAAMPPAAVQAPFQQPQRPITPTPAPQRGIGQRLYDNIIGDPTDGVQSTGEALGAWLNRGGESATFGVIGDEASAAATGMLPGRDYDSELARYRANEAGMSTAGRLSADLAGALVPGVGVAGGVARAGTWAGKAALGAGAGALGGGTLGYMEGEGVDDRIADSRVGGGIGGLVGGAIPATGGALQALLASRAASRVVKQAAKDAPTSAALRAEGNALYRQIDAAGVQIRPQAFDRLRVETTGRLRGETGFDELPGPGSLTPNTARLMQIMDEASGRMAAEPTAALPFRSLDQMRRQAGAAAGNVANKTDQKAGMAAIESMDDFVQRLGPDDVAAGDVKALQTAIPKAREVWGRMSRSQLIDDAMEKSDNYLSGSASGLRNQFKNILQNKKLAGQFSDAEKKAMRMVTHGGPLDQLVNLAGGGLAQMGSIGGGFAVGGVPGAMAGTALAAGQRKLAEAMVGRRAETARAAIAGGQLRKPEALAALMQAGVRQRLAAEAAMFGVLPQVTVGR